MTTASQKARLESIDALRGFDMLILVAGAAFLTALAPLLPVPFGTWLAAHMTHAEWGACYAYDYVFPTFLFMAGVSWPFSYAGQRAHGRTMREIHMKIFWRMTALLLLGWFRAGILKFDWDHLRLATVLGRIGIAWAVAAFLYMHTNLRWYVALCVTFLVGYWAIIYLIPNPGSVVPSGVNPISSPEYCLCNWVDRNFLEVCKPGNDGGAFATLGMPVTAMFGVLTGHLLRRTDVSGNRKTLMLLAGAAALTAIAIFWLPWCPNVKIIWTPTYALVSGAIAMALMAGFYWIIDVKGFRRWARIGVVFGVNSITIYMVAFFVSFARIGHYFLDGVAGFFDPQVGKVIIAAGRIGTMWLFLEFLMRKKIFLKI